jgi:hypothetical protein
MNSRDFRNPVRTIVRPVGWSRPRGNDDFRTTQEYGCTGLAAEPKLGNCAHFHRGIDISDGGCGAAVVAPAAGSVQFAGTLGNGEIVVVLDHGQGWGSSYGHLKKAVVTKGQRVTVGQKIGDVGATGFANGCHLHYAVKSGLPADFTKLDFIPNPLGGRGDSTGKWLDPWPLLNQPAEEDGELDMIITSYLAGHQAVVNASANIRPNPDTASPVLRTLTTPETWTVIGWVKGALVSGSDQWLARWSGRFEYVHRINVGSVTAPGGDCTAEVAAAKAPLETALGAANQRIQAALTALTS